MNAQTERIRDTLSRHEPLATARGRVLGQVVFCEGCCCGRTDKGFKPVPRDRIKQRWKEEKLNKSVQLTISGCLGPCDLANVLCVISPRGMQWFGGLQEQWQYDLLVDWANASRDAGCPARIARGTASPPVSNGSRPGVTLLRRDLSQAPCSAPAPPAREPAPRRSLRWRSAVLARPDGRAGSLRGHAVLHGTFLRRRLLAPGPQLRVRRQSIESIDSTPGTSG